VLENIKTQPLRNELLLNAKSLPRYGSQMIGGDRMVRPLGKVALLFRLTTLKSNGNCTIMMRRRDIGVALSFQWDTGYAEHPDNELADSLAKTGALFPSPIFPVR